MIGLKQMVQVLEQVEKRRAKVVLIGDPERLQGIGRQLFRAISERLDILS